MKRERRGLRIRGAIVLWAVLSALEIILVGRLDVQETPVGVAVALIAAAATAAMLAASTLVYRIRLGWLWLPLLVVRNVARDTVIVYGALFRRLAGARIDDGFIDIPFDPGGADALSVTRRALAIAAVSTSPNEIVVRAGRSSLRAHALVISDQRRRSREWPL